MRQKLDAGAILVHGKEELPLSYEPDDNNSHINHEEDNNHDHRIAFENDKDQHLLSTESLHRRTNDSGSDASDGMANHEDTRTNKNRNESTTKDKNANAKLPRTNGCTQRQSATLPRRRRRRALTGNIMGNPLPPHRVTPDGTAIYYWCELPRRPGSQGNSRHNFRSSFLPNFSHPLFNALFISLALSSFFFCHLMLPS